MTTSWHYLQHWTQCPSNFLKPVCAQNSCVQHFASTHFYIERHVWKRCIKHFFKENLCVLKVFLCALTCSHAQLRGNIDWTHILTGTLLSCFHLHWPPISVACDDLLVQFSRNSTLQYWVFAVVGPSIWSDLPLELCLQPRSYFSADCLTLKTSFQLCLGWECLWVGI